MGITDWVVALCDLPREYSDHPIAYRSVRYPNGSIRMQGEYNWCEGLRTGSTWKDLPLINVDKYGVEVQ